MKPFIKEHVDATPIEDNVFKIVRMVNEAKATLGEGAIVDATIGALYDEEGKLVAYDSVYDHYNEIPNREKARYATSFNGNADFREQVEKWVLQNTDVHLACTVVGTPGGSGAVSTTIVDTLDEGETLIIPEIAWGSYKLMAQMSNINVATYAMFEGDHFNVASFKEVCAKVMDEQGKVVAVINDPCHNPTGYSLSNDEWKELVAFANELSKKGPFIFLNDIAYIDYSNDVENSRKYMENFNDISDNVIVVVCFSCSKTLTSYGLRCGAAVVLAQKQESVRQMEIVFEKTARATWSNIPNAAMDNFVYVTTEGVEPFKQEKANYIALMKQRSELFLSEAKEAGLPVYPYKEGFFVTIAESDPVVLENYHQALLANHIYTVKVNKGIRVAVCSLSLAKCKGLAKRMKDILDSVKG